MQATSLVQLQLNGVHQLFHECVEDLTESEWTTTVLPGTNMPAFTLWHMARTKDWAVQTAIRGITEVFAEDRWASWRAFSIAGMGAGITLKQANELGRSISRTDVLAYSDAVHSAIMDWLSKLNDNDLDSIPDMETHMAAYPAYQQSGFKTEIANLLNQPIWRLLSGPCNGHLREHLGELEVLKQVMRGGVSQVS